MFNIGDLVRLHYSHHIGIVIGQGDWIQPQFDWCEYSYHIKWAVGEPITWETAKNLRLIAGVNNV